MVKYGLKKVHRVMILERHDFAFGTFLAYASCCGFFMLKQQAQNVSLAKKIQFLI